MVNITITDGYLFTKSKYDERLVKFMRSRPKRFWDVANRQWRLPEEDLGLLLKELEGYEYEVTYTDGSKPNLHNEYDPEKITQSSDASKPQITEETKQLVIKNVLPDWYKFKTKPYLHQIDGVNYGLQHPRFLLGDEPGLGKALDLDTKVYTPDGYKLMRDIKVGDLVFNKQGNPVKVLETFTHSNVQMYEITFSDGFSVKCCEDHLWEVFTSSGKKVVDTLWLFTKNLKSKGGRFKYSIGLCNPVKFNKVDLELDPYEYGCNVIKNKDRNILDCYKYNNVITRLRVLQGIFDSKGTISNYGSLYLVSGSEQLIDDIIFLVQSLGFIAKKLKVSLNTLSDKSLYKVVVYGVNSSDLVTEESKIFKLQKKSNNTKRNIVDIKQLGRDCAKCITVDDPSGLYLIDHFIVTHNTKQMLDISQILKSDKNIRHVLIIACVNSLKYNWQAEVGIHTNDKGYILGTRTTRTGKEKIGSNEDRLEDIKNIGESKSIDDCYYLITNIETLRYNKVVKVPLKTKKNGVQRFKKQTVFPIVEALQEQINNGNIGMIICDESHKCLSYDTLVKTDKGLVKIGDIVNNQCYLIKTLNEDGTLSFVKPVNYFTNPIQPYMLELTIQLKNGKTKKIVCTADHKFLTENRGYVKAVDLNEKDEVVEFD